MCPAVWATEDGHCGIAEEGVGLPLGIEAGEVYPVSRRQLTGSGAFVMVTDGVVEGPSFSIEKGLDQILRLVRAGALGDPGLLAAQVIRVAELTGHSDDAAVLVLRHDSGPGLATPADTASGLGPREAGTG
jgi:serine phosphatase RsbU (regulator of sigma subunit)